MRILVSVAVLIVAAAVSYFVFFNKTSRVTSQNITRQFNYANNCFMRGDYDEAIVGFKRVVESDPQCEVAYLNIGLALTKKGACADALFYYKKALSFKPDFAPMVHFNYGVALYQIGDHDNALAQFKKVSALDKNNAQAHVYAAKILQDQNKLIQAFSYFKKAALCNADYVSPLCSLGIKFRDEHEFATAIDVFNAALEIKPNSPRIHLFLGDVLNMQHNMDEALAAYKKAIEFDPNNHEALHNAGMILINQDKREEGSQLLERVLKIKPDFYQTHLGLCCIYLAEGNFERGWQEYEWRLKKSPYTDVVFKKPLWNGSDLQGKTILLRAEQGLGDTFMFIRYAQLFKERGARVLAYVQNPLVDILSRCDFIDAVFGDVQRLPEHDYNAWMMSTPALCKTTLDTIPAKIPYLHADQQLVELWREKLSKDKNIKIGICWNVDPSHDLIIHGNADKEIKVSSPKRSIPLKKLATLAQIEGVSLYSLQQFNGLDELDDLPNKDTVYLFGDDFDRTHGRFMDTAAVMKNLDVVITADTSIAHLAGGLGVPTWILLPHQSEWRWLRNRNDSPWYPTMRLFKQPARGDWDAVIDEVKQELCKRFPVKSTTKVPFA